MGPAQPKKEYKYEPPKWIDENVVKSLPKEKQKYWAARIKGAKVDPQNPKLIKTSDVTIGFDNDGNMVAKTRAMRRRKLPTENKYTKATHSIKKARSKK